MFISALDLFKLSLGPSSSHTLGPLNAALAFREKLQSWIDDETYDQPLRVQCILKGSLAQTGKGHATDKAIALGLHGFRMRDLVHTSMDERTSQIWGLSEIFLLPHPESGLPSEPSPKRGIAFFPETDIVFDTETPASNHPNEMSFRVLSADHHVLMEEIIYSIGGGFLRHSSTEDSEQASHKEVPLTKVPFPFDRADTMLEMAQTSGSSIAEMKLENEAIRYDKMTLEKGLQSIWQAMERSVEQGLATEGVLPGGLKLKRRAKGLFYELQTDQSSTTVNDWLCTYAMAVNEENASGHIVVTAPTNGAAGVIPAILYYWVHHKNGTFEQVKTFLLTAAAIGGLIKHNSSISGAEMGCQGEIGTASAMAAAGLCAVRGGTPKQIEKAAEMALEHHLGSTCDPVNGLVQIPCIERNGFGAIKAFTAASLALRESGEHKMSLDNCIEAMRQTGEEMSVKLKETSLGGLAVSYTEC